MSERFYVVENSPDAANRRPPVLVLDRAYSHRVVARFRYGSFVPCALEAAADWARRMNEKDAL